MNFLSNYVRRKLSVKVSLWVVLFAAIIFIAALTPGGYQPRHADSGKHISACRAYPQPR